MKLAASNCLVLAGFAAIIYGMATVHPALGWLTGGAAAFAIALAVHRRK